MQVILKPDPKCLCFPSLEAKAVGPPAGGGGGISNEKIQPRVVAKNGVPVVCPVASLGDWVWWSPPVVHLPILPGPE